MRLTKKRVEQRLLNQKAVYWPPAGTDDFGKRLFDVPREISVRWEDVREEFLDREGNRTLSRSKVYHVDTGTEELGVLVRGRLNVLVSTTDPFANPRAFEVRKIDDVPDLKATFSFRTAWL